MVTACSPVSGPLASRSSKRAIRSRMQASVAAGSRILQLARSCQSADRCIVLLSGGASALLVQPVRGVTLADKQSVTRRLLDSGASIAEINTVRRKLSRIKGGGLAAQIRADEILLLAISDVPGDALADIGSGPLSPDTASRAEARAIVARYGIPLAPAIARALEDPVCHRRTRRLACPPISTGAGPARRQVRHAQWRRSARAAEAAGWRCSRPARSDRAGPGRRAKPRGPDPGLPGAPAADRVDLRR